MTLRLFHDYFIGEITTIGYDYSKSCYDYSSRNATTIADLYWLSGESPKRDTAAAINGSAPLPLDYPARLARSAVCCTVWHGSITGLHPYIPYYNRAAALTCAASGVAQAVLYPLVSVWYRERLNGSNSRKNTCKALCAVLCRWRYSCIDDAKRAVNACILQYCSRAK